MKSTNFHLFLGALAICGGLTSLTSCSSDDPAGMDGAPVAAQITATIGDHVATRAANNSWAEGDKIGITTLRQGVSKYVNMEYTTENGDGVFTGNTMYFQDKTEPVTFTAYYPFTGTEGTAPGNIEANTDAANQTSDKQTDIDFLWDQKTSIKGSDPKVNFKFAHKMSKLTLTFKNGTGADVSKITSYDIEGLTLDGTFDPTTGEATVKSDADATKLTMTVSNVVSGVSVPSLILFPQATGNHTVMLYIHTNDGQKYGCKLGFSGGEMASGNDYRFTITVNKTGLDVETSTIHDWNPVNEEDLNASLQ